MEIKNILKSRREELGLTMKEVAQKVGVSEGTISRWESGDIQNMRRDKIVALAKALQLSPSIIMGWEEDKTSKDPSEGEKNSLYYLNPETAQIAQQVYDDPDMRVLFDAAKDSKPEDIRMAAEMLKRFKETNPDG